VPFAPDWPFELHVRAKRHGVRRLTDLTVGERRDLAAALREVVRIYDQLYDEPLAYLMACQQAPADLDGRPAEDWHLSFEFLPPNRAPDKLKVRATVETAAGLFINDTVPEASAAQLAAVSTVTEGVEVAPIPDVEVVPALGAPTSSTREPTTRRQSPARERGNDEEEAVDRTARCAGAVMLAACGGDEATDDTTDDTDTGAEDTTDDDRGGGRPTRPPTTVKPSACVGGPDRTTSRRSTSTRASASRSTPTGTPRPSSTSPAARRPRPTRTCSARRSPVAPRRTSSGSPAPTSRTSPPAA
jgi:hypothetical protein